MAGDHSGENSADFDAVVVGAGAAGIAAGRRLAEAGLRILIVEARSRLGGRAHTLHAGGFPIDLGCEWLHSADRNPLTGLAKQLEFTVDETLPDWGRLRRPAGSIDDEQNWQRSRDVFYERLRREASQADRPAATLLAPGNRWNSLLDAISSWANGVELDGLSIVDFANYADSGFNWRVAEGYGVLIRRLGRDLPVRLDSSVTRIDHREATIRVETARGILRTRTVLVTIPSNLIAAEAITFEPSLPPEKIAAAAGLPLGLANKLFLRIEEGGVALPPSDSHVLGATDRTRTGSYHLQPLGRPIIEGYFGGALARELERAGASAMADFARDELVGIFGSGIRRHLHLLAASAWESDPYARGSYSRARPGHAADRAILARPVEDRLFFAGEACSPHDFSTAHGAWLSGIDAAKQIIPILKSAG